MPFDLLNCCACLLRFDLADRLPKILSSCGHTICAVCLNKIINSKNPHRCPVDQTQFQPSSKNIDCFLTNITILQLLEPKLEEDIGFCKDHDEPNNSVCLCDKCKTCKYCAYYGRHKGHRIKHINDIRSETQLKITKLQNLLNEVENDDKAINSLLEEMPKTMLALADMRFEKLKQLLEEKLQQIKREIGLFYALEGVKMEEKLQADLEIKKSVQEKISGLSDTTLGLRFFDAFMDEKTEQLFPNTQYRQLLGLTQEMNEKFEKSLECLENTITPFLHSFQLKFPIHEPLKLDESVMIKRRENQKLSSLKSFFNFEENNDSLMISPKESISLDTDVSVFEKTRNRKVSLGLNRSQTSGIQLEAIQYLWNELDEITELEVDMSNATCTDEELSTLCMPYFWSTEKVKRFSLNLFRTQIGDQTLINILREAASEMLNLKHIYLQLGETKLTDKSFEAFPKYMLPSMTALETFQLDLSFTQVTDLSMKQVSLNMKNIMKDVNTFTLNLSGTTVSDKTINMFTKHALPTMKTLENFQFYLGGTQVTDNGVKQLCTSLKNMDRKLKTFGLALGGTKVTDKSIEALSQSILPLMSILERLELYVGKTQVSDNSIQQFFKNAKGMARDVKFLVLGLDSLKISDRSAECLIDYLVSIKTCLKGLKVFLDDSKVSDHNKKLIFDIQDEVSLIVLGPTRFC